MDERKINVDEQNTVRGYEKRRDDIAAGMKERGIPVGIYYPKCFHEQPVFQPLGYSYGDFPESEKASREVLSLPMHPFQIGRASCRERSYITGSEVLSE